MSRAHACDLRVSVLRECRIARATGKLKVFRICFVRIESIGEGDVDRKKEIELETEEMTRGILHPESNVELRKPPLCVKAGNIADA